MSTTNIYELLKTYIPKEFFDHITTLIHINDTYSKWIETYKDTLDSYNNDENELLILRAILNNKLKHFTLIPPNPSIPPEKKYLYTDVFETIMSEAHEWCTFILTSDVKCVIATNPYIKWIFNSANTWSISRKISSFFSWITPNVIKTLKYGRWGLSDSNTLGNNIEMITRLFYSIYRLNYLYCALNNNEKPSIIKSARELPSNEQNTIGNYLYSYEIIYTNGILERVSIKQTVENYMKKFVLTTVSGIILPVPVNIKIPQSEINTKYFMAFILYLFATNSYEIENSLNYNKDINTSLSKCVPILKSLLVYNILQTNPPNSMLNSFLTRYPKISFIKKIIIQKTCNITDGFKSSGSGNTPDEYHRELTKIANTISNTITTGSIDAITNLSKLSISADYLIPDNIYNDLIELKGFKLSEIISENKPLNEYLSQTITHESIVRMLRSNTIITVLDVSTTGAIKGASTAVIGTGLTAAIASTGIIVSAPISGPIILGVATTGAIAGAVGSVSNEFLGINEGIASMFASCGLSYKNVLSSQKFLSIKSSADNLWSATLRDKASDDLIKNAVNIQQKLDLAAVGGRTRAATKIFETMKDAAYANKKETVKLLNKATSEAASTMSSVLVEAGIMATTATTVSELPKIRNGDDYTSKGSHAMGFGVEAINTNPKMLYPAITRKAINRKKQNTKKNSKSQIKPQIYKYMNFTPELKNNQFPIPLLIESPNTLPINLHNTIPRIAPNLEQNVATNFSRNPIDETSFFISPSPFFNMEMSRHPTVNQLPRPEATAIPFFTKNRDEPKSFFDYPQEQEPEPTFTPYTNQQRVNDIRKSQARHQAFLSNPLTMQLFKYISTKFKIGNRFINHNYENNNNEIGIENEDISESKSESKVEHEAAKSELENKVEAEIKKESEVCIKYIDTFMETYFDKEGNLNLKIVEYNFKDFFDKLPSFNENNMLCLIAIFNSLKLKFIEIKNKDTTSLKYEEFIELLYTLKKMILFIEEFYDYYVVLQSEQVPNLNENNEVPILDNSVIIVWIGVSKDSINKIILNYLSMYKNNNYSHVNMTPYGDTLLELYPVIVSQLEIDNTPKQYIEYNTLNCVLNALGISLENFDKITELFHKEE